MAWLRGSSTAAALVSVAGLALVAASCGGGSDDGDGGGSGGGGTLTIEGALVNDRGTKDVSGTSEVEVELGDHYFEPTILVGTPGQKVKLQLVNRGALEHNFTVDSPQVAAVWVYDQDVRSGGGMETIEIGFPKKGDLLFLCKYHEGQGMAGVLRAAS